MVNSAPDDVRKDLARVAPTLWTEISSLADRWLSVAIRNLDQRLPASTLPKSINDPVWGTIQLLPWELALLDSPLLQRLKGIRQLGMAHHVYPGAGHSRFEHSIGVVEGAERIIQALRRNAEHRQMFARETLPKITEEDRVSIRLAALLHDTGHGPFSHAGEPLLRSRLDAEFNAAEERIVHHFQHPGTLSPSETIAVLLVLADRMRDVLTHKHFEAAVRPADLSVMIAARIVGSPLHVGAPYVARIVNGPLDADKLDYMARDSHHSGLPLGIDLDRIISKLEVVSKRDESADESIVQHHLGVSASGLGAYEQMIIARVFLYDRLYYHHKVRTVDAMAHRLIRTAEEELGRPYNISELMETVSDETLIATAGGLLSSKFTPSGGTRAERIARLIRERDFYVRAFVFAERFIDRVPDSLGSEAKETRGLIWSRVRNHLAAVSGTDNMAKRIYDRACELRSLPAFLSVTGELRPEHVIVDLSSSPKVTVGATEDRVTATDELLLTRLEDGTVQKPNLFFDPAKWSFAYQTQKHAGYVFAPREFVSLIAAASALAFFETFNLVMATDATKIAKTQSVDLPTCVREAAEKGLCSAEAVEALANPAIILKRVFPEDFRIPEEWERDTVGIRDELCQALKLSSRRGFPASMHRSLIDLLEHLMTFVSMTERTGKFVKTAILESDLQRALREHLESRGVNVTEGSRVGGGETDLVVPGPIVIENKRRGETADPFSASPEYEWQTRRYSIAVSSNVSVVVVAYKPASPAALLSISRRLRIQPLKMPEQRLQIRVVIPYDYGVPSAEPAAIV